MPDRKSAALKRRIAPSTRLSLSLDCEGGQQMKIDLKLCFDMNAGAAIEEKTGISILDWIATWRKISSPSVLGAMLWGAALAHQPEYTGDQGLEIIRSYIQDSNSDEIVEALWKAYLAFLPEKKRELVIKAREDAEAENPPEAAPATAAAATEQPDYELIPQPPKTEAGSSSGPSPDTTLASASANSGA